MGNSKIQMDLKREYAEVIHKSQNPVMFLIAMALASREFKDYDTVDEIFDLEAARNMLSKDGSNEPDPKLTPFAF
jgi:hypothetical protein